MLIIVIVMIEYVLSSHLVQTPFVTGWGLFALILWLAGYRLCKKLPFFPRGGASGWLQFHICCGLMTSVVFAIHTGFRFPNGGFEQVMALMYLFVFISGVIGYVLTRAIPFRLATRGEKVDFTDIRESIQVLRKKVEQLVFSAAATEETSALSDFYLHNLGRFFEGPQNMLGHLMHSDRTREMLLLQLQSQQQIASTENQAVLTSIASHVAEKDRLDYHFALNGALVFWLFVHVPATYGLIVLAVFHLIAVYAFGGGI